MDRSLSKHSARAWLLAALVLAFSAAGMAGAQDKGAGFDDALITERVASVLDNDPMLRQMDIAIETHGQVVHLRGFVNSMSQVERAGALARGVQGVMAVRNAIRVAVRPSRA